MQKIIFYLLPFTFYLLPFSLHAQADHFQLPDSDFAEGWQEEFGSDGLPYFEYQTEFFYTLNSLRAVPELGDITAWKDINNKYYGECSIRLVSGKIRVGTEDVFLPGMVGTINSDFVREYLDSNNEEITISREWDYNIPHALEGWYQYIPASGDSASIEIGFYNYEELIFVEKMIIKNAVPGWTHFSIPIPEQYRNDPSLNQIRILFIASAGVNFANLMECKGQIGSILWIDHINLNYELGIKQNLFSTLKAKTFPNPAHEFLTIELNENFTGKIAIYDLSGRMVLEENINGTEYPLNIATLSSGNYIYKLINENTIFAQGKFVVTK